jgi:hypothetical protein
MKLDDGHFAPGVVEVELRLDADGPTMSVRVTRTSSCRMRGSRRVDNEAAADALRTRRQPACSWPP